MASGDTANIADFGVVADRVSFFFENLGLVKSDPARRPAPLEEFVSAIHWDAIPVLVADEVEVARLVEDGDKEFAVGCGADHGPCRSTFILGKPLLTLDSQLGSSSPLNSDIVKSNILVAIMVPMATGRVMKAVSTTSPQGDAVMPVASLEAATARA